jgi:HSP20 family protein
VQHIAAIRRLAMNMMQRWEPFMSSWDPLRDLETARGRMAALFGPLPRAKDLEKDEALTVAEWAPLVDIVEDDQEYLIKAELPEVKKEDIKVSVADDVLTISGERVMMKEEKNKKCRRIERAYGSFARSFALPDDADPGKVAADFKDGLLKVRLPKSAKRQARSVDVKVA